MPDVLQLADRLKAQIAARDEKSLRVLVDAYKGIYKRLQGDMDALMQKIVTNPGKYLTQNGLSRLDQYQRLMTNLETEMGKYKSWVNIELQRNTTYEIGQGIKDAQRLIQTAAGDIGASVQMNRVPVEVVQEIVGFLDPKGPLYERLSHLDETVKLSVRESITAQVREVMIQGVGVGDNPRTIARAMAALTDSMGIGLTDSMRMMRTAQLYAYREANRASYVANSDVVMGWTWYAHLGTACMSCVAMHGSEHPLDEVLDDHHSGECVAIPAVIGGGNPVKENGETWFSKQPEAQQRERMGGKEWLAWKDGQIKFSQMSVEHDDPVYGKMRSTASYKSLNVDDSPF